MFQVLNYGSHNALGYVNRKCNVSMKSVSLVSGEPRFLPIFVVVQYAGLAAGAAVGHLRQRVKRGAEDIIETIVSHTESNNIWIGYQ